METVRTKWTPSGFQRLTSAEEYLGFVPKTPLDRQKLSKIVTSKHRMTLNRSLQAVRHLEFD